MIETDAWGSELASWTPLLTLATVFALIVAALVVYGRGSALERIPNGLELADINVVLGLSGDAFEIRSRCAGRKHDGVVRPSLQFTM